MPHIPYRPFGVALFAALLPLALVAAASVHFGIRIPAMTRDVAAIADLHPLAGFLSSLGVLLWWTSASVWLFSAGVHRARESGPLFMFALSSGLLSVYLALDDLFQFHEMLAPTYLGLSEEMVYGALGLAMATYLFTFRRLLARADGVLLLIAFAFLAGSVVVDAVLERWLWRIGHWTFLVEDGMKWLGIVSWCCFCVVRCRSDVLAAPRVSVSTGQASFLGSTVLANEKAP